MVAAVAGCGATSNTSLIPPFSPTEREEQLQQLQQLYKEANGLLVAGVAAVSAKMPMFDLSFGNSAATREAKSCWMRPAKSS
jgi:hypothetical protein